MNLQSITKSLKKQWINEKFKDAKHIISLLGGASSTKLVGGVVRDILLGLDIKDIDIATTLTPQHVITALENNGIKVIPTGIDFGTVTAITKDHSQYEITTLRTDDKCDGRHAKIHYTNSWEEDAKRRDFTINGLYLDIPEIAESRINHKYQTLDDASINLLPSASTTQQNSDEIAIYSFNIYDYVGGIQDLQNKHIKFIGNAAKRIEEDYLRIIRFFRMQSIFAKQGDEKDTLQCIELSNNLHKISAERMRTELEKTLLAPYPLFALNQMQKFGILNKMHIEAKQITCKISDKSTPYNSLQSNRENTKTKNELIKQHSQTEKNYFYSIYGMQVSSNFNNCLSQEYINILNLCIFLIASSSTETVKTLKNLKYSNKHIKLVKKILDISNELQKNRYSLDTWKEQLYFAIYLENPSEYKMLSVFLFHLQIALSHYNLDSYNNINDISIQQNLYRWVPKPLPINGNDIIKNLNISSKQIGTLLSHLKQHWLKSEFSLSTTQLLKIARAYVA